MTKRKTVKAQLIERMVELGNTGITYTEMIKMVLDIVYPGRKYDWRTDRGFYSTNFTQPGRTWYGGNTKGGYMIAGGTEQVFKYNGRWFAFPAPKK